MRLEDGDWFDCLVNYFKKFDPIKKPEYLKNIY